MVQNYGRKLMNAIEGTAEKEEEEKQEKAADAK